MSSSKTRRNILLTIPYFTHFKWYFFYNLKKIDFKYYMVCLIESKDNFATELIKKFMILVIVVGSLYRRFNGMLKYDHYSGELNVKVRSL